MFEKLKEYGLYIILGLIALGALAYAYVQTSNSQKGAEIHEANLDAMVTNLAKSDKLKKTSTVADNLLNANGGKTIGKYKIDSSKISYVIGETYEDIFENKQMLDISADVADVEDGQLRTVLIAKPAVQVNGNDVNTVNLNSDKSLTIGNNTISKDDLKDVADELKGYNISAIGYTSFDTEQEAKDFRDTYFSNYEVYQIGNTGKYIILTEYFDGGNTTIENKINTETRSDLLTLNNANQQNNNEPTEEELLTQEVNTIKTNLNNAVVELQSYLTSQGLNSSNNTTITNQINQVIAKINGINGTNKDAKNTEIQNDITTIHNLIDTLKAEEIAAASIPTCEGYQELVGGVCQTAIYLDSNGITMKATNYAIAGHEYTLSGTTYYVASSKQDISNKIFVDNYPANRIITSKITNLSYLFSTYPYNRVIPTGVSEEDHRLLIKAFNQNIGNWDIFNVTDLRSMFRGASAFNNGGSDSINNWNLSHVTQFSAMFYGASSFNQPIGNWDVSHISSFYMLFDSASSFNQNIGSWNVSNVNSMNETFIGASAFNNGGSDSIKNWNVSNVTDFSQAFQGASSFNQNIGSWNVSHATNMFQMFASASSFNQDLSGWNISNVTTYRLFSSSSSWPLNRKPDFPCTNKMQGYNNGECIHS